MNFLSKSLAFLKQQLQSILAVPKLASYIVPSRTHDRALSEGLGLLIFRGTSGGICKPSNPPELPLTLWAYEGSPFVKLVKEKFCELQLMHMEISCPPGSANQQQMFSEQGRFQVPFLQDPNTGVELFESKAIVEYLEKQYSVAKSPVKYM